MVVGGRNGYSIWMAQPPFSVHPIVGEFAMPLASRLTRANRVPLREFLNDMAIRPNDLVAGEHVTVARLADHSGVPGGHLRKTTPRISNGKASLGGFRFLAASIGGKEVRGCADCLEIQPGLRGLWTLPFVTICAEHKPPLTILRTVQDKLDPYDVAERLPALDLIAGERPERRDPSQFELWFLGKLEGNAPPTIGSTSSIFFASAQFCSELGRAAIATKLPKWRAFHVDQQWWPSDVGFRRCLGSLKALRAALTELQHLMGQPEEGPRKIFGCLHDLLAAGLAARNCCPSGTYYSGIFSKLGRLRPVMRFWASRFLLVDSQNLAGYEI